MERLLKILKSRTTWTVVALFLINGVSAIEAYIPAGWLPAVNGALSLLALYFKQVPSQEY